MVSPESKLYRQLGCVHEKRVGYMRICAFDDKHVFISEYVYHFVCAQYTHGMTNQ